MVRPLQANHCPVHLAEECLPVVGRHNDVAVVVADQLRQVYASLRRLAHHLDNVCHAGDLGAAEEALQQAETPIRCKLCVASMQKGDAGGCIQARRHPPSEAPHHGIVFVLSGAVVRVQLQMMLSGAVVRQEVMEVADHHVRPFAARNTHPLGDALGVNAEDLALPRCLKVDRSRLLLVAWVVYLLREVETVVVADVVGHVWFEVKV